MYKRQGSELLVGDIATISADQIPDVDLATASFPCQDLSLAGKRAGLSGKRSGTFYQFIRILGEFSAQGRPPSIVLVENVSGLLTSHRGKDIREVLLSLNRLGYACDLLLIDAAYFIPQSRPRVFVLGFFGPQTTSLIDDSAFLHPFRPPPVRKVVQANFDLAWRFLKLPNISRMPHVSLAHILEKNQSLNWFDDGKLERELSYIRNKSKERLSRALRTAQVTGKPVYLTAYRRMRQGAVCLEIRDDGIAGCLRAPTGGSSRQILIEVTPQGSVRMRYMTAREYGRLQGVPDSFWIPERQQPGLRAFGDAVAVPVLRWIGRILKNHLVHR